MRGPSPVVSEPTLQAGLPLPEVLFSELMQSADSPHLRVTPEVHQLRPRAAQAEFASVGRHSRPRRLGCPRKKLMVCGASEGTVAIICVL